MFWFAGLKQKNSKDGYLHWSMMSVWGPCVNRNSFGLGPLKVIQCMKLKNWEKLNRGVSKPGGFPLFSGKVQIVSRTLSGLFLVGALKRPRKRKKTNRENPRTIPEQIGKIPETSGKSPKGQKRTKKEGQVQIGNPPPPWNPPVCRPLKKRLVAHFWTTS